MIATPETQMVERQYSRRFPFALSTTSSPHEEPAASATTFDVALDSSLFLYACARRPTDHMVPVPVRSGPFIFVESEEASYGSTAECVISPQLRRPAYRSRLLASLWKSLVTAKPTTDQDVVNWEYAVPAPARPSGTIRVKLSFAGRGKPLPFDPD